MDEALKEEYIVGLSVLATVGLAFMWWSFWKAVEKKQESILQILSSPSFFKTVTVMGVIAATVVLSLAEKAGRRNYRCNIKWHCRLCTWPCIKFERKP